MEYIIVGVIVLVAGCMLYLNIKKQVNGDCGCGNCCRGCSYNCGVKSSNKNEDQIHKL